MDAGMSREDIAEKQFANVKNRINRLSNLDCDNRVDLLKAINKVAGQVGWKVEHKKAFSELIDERVGTSVVSEDGTTRRRANQDCPTIELYCTKDDNIKLRDMNMSNHARIQVFKALFRRLGIYVAAEGLKGRVADIIKHVSGEPDMEPEAFLALLKKVKKALAPLQKIRDWPHEFLQNYPADPDELKANHAEIYNHAYPKDPPEKQHVDGVDTPDFLRKSSSLLKQTTTVCKPEAGTADMKAMMSMFGSSVANVLSRVQDNQYQVAGYGYGQGYGYGHGQGYGYNWGAGSSDSQWGGAWRQHCSSNSNLPQKRLPALMDIERPPKRNQPPAPCHVDKDDDGEDPEEEHPEQDPEDVGFSDKGRKKI